MNAQALLKLITVSNFPKQLWRLAFKGVSIETMQMQGFSVTTSTDTQNARSRNDDSLSIMLSFLEFAFWVSVDVLIEKFDEHNKHSAA